MREFPPFRLDTVNQCLASRGVNVSRGYGSKEAYYPMLEALAGLCRGDGGDAIVQILAGAPAGERYPRNR